MQYSPKLKKAMAEIKAIMEKHDVTGVVILHTPGFSEYPNKVEALYSGFKVGPNGISVSINEKTRDKEEAHAIASDTFNQAYHIAHNLEQQYQNWSALYRRLQTEWRGRELPGGGHTSIDEQSN